MSALLVAGLVVACGAAVDVARRQTRRLRTRRRFPALDLGARQGGPTARFPAQERMEGWTRRVLADAAIAVDPARALAVWAAACAFAPVFGALLGGAVPAVGCAVAAVAGPLLVLRSMRGRAAVRAEADLPGVLEEIARGLRSGASMRQAVTEAAPSAPGLLGDELRVVAAAAERGGGLVDSLEAWATTAPRTGVRLTVAALCLGAETGGAQARAVDGVAATLRERLAVTTEVRALSSQTRASMLVIALSPLAFCAFASATDPRTSTFLFRTPAGVACLVAGLALDAVGALWMRRLCRVAT